MFVALLLLTTLVPLPAYGEENAPADRGDGVYENAGDWIIEEGEEVSHADRTIIVNGNLIGKATQDVVAACEAAFMAAVVVPVIITSG